MEERDVGFRDSLGGSSGVRSRWCFRDFLGLDGWMVLVLFIKMRRWVYV